MNKLAVNQFVNVKGLFWKIGAAVAVFMGINTLVITDVNASGTYPDKTVKVVVPFPPGGSTDTVGRLLATELSELLDQTFVVENRGGANGMIGSSYVARAASDGYTLLLSGIGSNAINYAIYPDISYKDGDFNHISLLATGPNVIAVNPSFPAQTIEEFFELVTESPGQYSYASAGVGSSGNLSMELIKQRMGLDLLHVPYKGNGPAIVDAISGEVPVIILNNDAALPHVKEGGLRALAVTSNERNPAYKDVPTLEEAGLEGIDVNSWFGLSAPQGTPEEIVSKLADATERALQAPQFLAYLQGTGFVSSYKTPEEMSGFVSGQISQWEEVVKNSDIASE